MTNPPSPVMTLHDLRFGYRSNTDWLGPVNANITAGQLWTIVGPNGSGKTTLLKLLAGLLSPTSGDVSIDGKPLSALGRRDRARMMAYLPQQPPGDVDTSVGDLVLMGRFPFRSWGLFESAEDRRIAEAAIATTAISHLTHRSVATLSGGEAHRAHLAAALAQQPQFLLLDEPTAALDLHHQLAVFGLLYDLVARHDTTVVAVTHDINLAARFGSHTILLNDGQVAAVGSPEEVLHEQQLSDVYRVRMKTATFDEPTDRLNRWLVPVEAIHK